MWAETKRIAPELQAKHSTTMSDWKKKRMN